MSTKRIVLEAVVSGDDVPMTVNIMTKALDALPESAELVELRIEEA